LPSNQLNEKAKLLIIDSDDFKELYGVFRNGSYKELKYCQNQLFGGLVYVDSAGISALTNGNRFYCISDLIIDESN
jgi:hypothetical protein